ncbi:UNKNOWN [Stylonychia lemnae]|uniref:Uncharacterized protein n=1 Tax=Stylonychia lemnae TaxID=5949 RepID=A0A078AZF5_STYLE|nr:UNKNOWN [Stylonychia lemnae]|eukprot:CDW87534.1 UNKNOWN [Stylonychia lemnae]
MQNIVAESYRVKAHLIFDRECLFKRPISQNNNEAREWQGFIKDIKNTIRTTSQKQKGEIIQTIHSVQNKIQIDQKNLQEQFSNLNDKFEEIQQTNENVLNFLKRNLSAKLMKADLMDNAIHLNTSGLNMQVKAIDKQVKQLDDQFKELAQGLDAKVLKIQDEMEFIRNSLIQLLQKNNQ